MKKLMTGLIALWMLSGVTMAYEVGFLDTEAIFQKANFVQTFRESFSEKEKEFNELLQKKSKKIEEAIADGKEEEKIREMVLERDKELEPKKQELMQYEMSFRQNFLLNITATSKKIAEEYGVDVVVDKQVVYFGGIDLTDLVIERLNK